MLIRQFIPITLIRWGSRIIRYHILRGVIHPDRYNIFAVEMYPDSLSFYVNDVHTFTYPRIQTKEEGQFPFNQPFYLLIDMQLGGSWVGAVSPEDLPVEMEVDWVRFYQRKSIK